MSTDENCTHKVTKLWSFGQLQECHAHFKSLPPPPPPHVVMLPLCPESGPGSILACGFPHTPTVRAHRGGHSHKRQGSRGPTRSPRSDYQVTLRPCLLWSLAPLHTWAVWVGALLVLNKSLKDATTQYLKAKLSPVLELASSLSLHRPPAFFIKPER